MRTNSPTLGEVSVISTSQWNLGKTEVSSLDNQVWILFTSFSLLLLSYLQHKVVQQKKNYNSCEARNVQFMPALLSIFKTCEDPFQTNKQ